VIKIFSFSLPSQPLLGHHFGFYIFFHNSILWGCTLFFTAGLDYYLQKQVDVVLLLKTRRCADIPTLLGIKIVLISIS